MLPISAQVDLEVFATGFTRPSAIASAGPDRLFVVEQAGKIFIADSALQLNGEPYLDITDRVGSEGNEQGLLGLAFHPDYQENGYFYVNYTDILGHTVISRFQASGTGPGFADPASEHGILTYPQPFENHNGGDIRFGPEGYLYISSGDGGSGGDPQDNAQNKASYLGKILRIDVDGGDPYAIPPDNPFAGETGLREEIWAYGLRNPWRFSFDRETGDLWIGDVGQQEIEEINFQSAESSAGENYGWRCYEGSAVYNDTDCPPDSVLTFPVHEYSHDPGHCSVTGGFVYRGTKYPSLEGHYFFADYCSDVLWSLTDSSGQWIVQDHGTFPENNFSTFGEDMDGELYVAGLTSGTIYRITAAATSFRQHPSALSRYRVYPNPVSARLWIEPVNGRPASGSIRLSITDLSGRTVHLDNSVDPGIGLDLQYLDRGIYIIKLESGNLVEYHRFFKE